MNKKECPEQDSNLHASRHTHLKRARLPIPPPGHIHQAIPDDSFLFNKRAENGTRTRDPNLGKVVLYQLSYFRKFPSIFDLNSAFWKEHFSKCGAKVMLFLKLTNFLGVFFQKIC